MIPHRKDNCMCEYCIVPKQPIIDKCIECKRIVDNQCIRYKEPAVLWQNLGNCPSATHIKVLELAEDEKKKKNPLKASKGLRKKLKEKRKEGK